MKEQRQMKGKSDKRNRRERKDTLSEGRTQICFSLLTFWGSYRKNYQHIVMYDKAYVKVDYEG